MSTPLHEQYRPKSWTEVVGQQKALEQIARLRERGGLSGRAFFLRGPSGSGKTTIARLIADEIAEPWNTVEANAADLSADDLRSFMTAVRCPGLTSSGKTAHVL